LLARGADPTLTDKDGLSAQECYDERNGKWFGLQ
jgi:hypothetical protein